MTAEVHRLAQAITCHAFNADQSKVALCPNTPEIQIFARSGDEWVLEQTLKEHDQVVSSIDWAPKTNRIVSCSHDRNAYVWTLTDGVWKPMLVILRINRAATHVKWSPEENKFAVASGSKTVSVCYFESDNNWWISKHLKKHRSTVLSVAWHPNNLLLATGGTDFKCRVYATAIRGVDKSNKSDFLTDKPLRTFGELLAEFDHTQGWIHSVSWNPGGNTLAWVSHDARVAFADITQSPPAVQVINLRGLPLCATLFIDDSTLVAAGHECNPVLLKWDDAAAQWAEAGYLDKEEQKKAGSVSAMNKFRNMDTLGQTGNTTEVNTKHQNCIYSLVSMGPGSISTSSVDGRLVIWQL